MCVVRLWLVMIFLQVSTLVTWTLDKSEQRYAYVSVSEESVFLCCVIGWYTPPKEDG